MANFNRVILMGNLVRDIELKYLPSGTAVSDFSIAVNDRRKAADGQWVDDPSFFEIVLYGRTAEVASEYLSKGSPVLIEGRLKQDTWEKDGQKRSKVKVIGEKMQMIGGKPGGTGTQETTRESVRESASTDQSNYVNSNQSTRPTAAAPPNRETQSHETHSHDAQPTGDGPGYDEPDIPF